MKMSGAPWALANERSWCTGMKSRVAIAPATIRVAVTSMTIGGSTSPARIAEVESHDRHSAPRAEQRQHQTVVEVLEGHDNRHADRHLLGRDADEVGHEARPLLQLDECDDVWVSRNQGTGG